MALFCCNIMQLWELDVAPGENLLSMEKCLIKKYTHTLPILGGKIMTVTFYVKYFVSTEIMSIFLTVLTVSTVGLSYRHEH